ncbi:NADH-ubiquinone/plastoquinone oxidoreductase chain 6 [Elusimicrobium minutum Pei191]|uniref:NADH-quinone oxidoreductase subunit J n=1 Tax=Elusimicrobium minutum (strain Pei191) TaxID=445932 RepID=B2KDU1_ELUMP|nr:NADH-quinone oxidoreductase subunit J [Elusimicrobium minutum]ACC98687.1 NADH-ubiquinone/plastoquinone oxidoreductase chain 6 [Elusimicrobium minutum Pei191]
MTLHLLILTGLVGTALFAAISRNFIYAAMWLALLSATLTGVMFSMGAPWAGVFELSVCSGLITVLFASTASLLGADSKYARNERKFMRFLPLGLFLFGVVLWFISFPYSDAIKPNTVADMEPMLVGDIIWSLRYKDLIAQICIFVAGVLMVKTFFGGKGHE